MFIFLESINVSFVFPLMNGDNTESKEYILIA